MAKITINVMGVNDERRIMDLIIQTVSREGRYILRIQSNQSSEDLMANKLVGFKVLTRKLIKDQNNCECFEFSEGDNFASAKLQGTYKWIEEEKKRLNPNYTMRQWNKFSNNALLAGLIGSVVGAVIGSLITVILA